MKYHVTVYLTSYDYIIEAENEANAIIEAQELALKEMQDYQLKELIIDTNVEEATTAEIEEMELHQG